MCGEVHHVTLYIHVDEFADQKVEFDLIPSEDIPHKEPTDADSDENTVLVTDVTDAPGEMVM